MTLTTLIMAPTILFIDEDEDALNEINEALKNHVFDIYQAKNRQEALDILNQVKIAVVVCDWELCKAPGINILETLQNKFPETVRIMLTDSIDVETLLSSINQGHVYRFIPKPWELDDLVIALADALHLHQLLMDRHNFHQDLVEINSSLEERVSNATVKITNLYDELENSFGQTIEVLLSILELSSKLCVAHSKRTATRVRAIARELHLSKSEKRSLQHAALLHWIGLSTIDASFFTQHLWKMPDKLKPTWEFHALLAQQALSPIKALQETSNIIANYVRPDLAPENIKRSCQILAVSSFFEHANFVHRHGKSQLNAKEIEEIRDAFLIHYPFFDTKIIEALFQTVNYQTPQKSESKCNTSSLKVGMTLSRSVVTNLGIPIVPANRQLNYELIDVLRNQENTLDVYIWDEDF